MTNIKPKIILIFLCLILLFPSLSLNANEITADRIDQDRPKIGLVLSGGGARGAAHVGVIKVLEENNIPVDVITGTSFGAIVGGLYATGRSADELQEILEQIDWQETLSAEAPRKKKSFRRKQDDAGFLIKFKLGVEDGSFNLPSGLITPNNLRLTLRDLVGDNSHIPHFDQLPIPFRAVATDLITGDEVILDRGDLSSAIVASMAVPALFPPVDYKDTLLVDGGIANNLPIQIARDMGADIVIVVDISGDMLKKDELTSFASVLDQISMIQTHLSSNQQLKTLKTEDILIKPDLGSMGMVEFNKTLEAVPKGRDAALDALGDLKKIALNQQDWQEHLAHRVNYQGENPVIDFVRIKNESSLSNEVIKKYLSTKPGEILDSKKMADDLTRIYGLGVFDEVNYQTVRSGNEYGVDIIAKQPDHGEDYVRFGMAIQDDFEGENGYQLAAGFTNLAINERGGEWQALFKLGREFSVFTEIYQPIDYSQKYYLFATAEGAKENVNLRTGGRDIIEAQARVSSLEIAGGLGRNFGNWGTLRIGLEKGYANIKGRIGLPEDLSVNAERTNFNTVFVVDTMNERSFPKSGMFLSVEYTNGLSIFNSDGTLDAVSTRSYIPYTWGKNTIGLNSSFTTTFNGNPDETDVLQLGGFLGLSAFSQGQIVGNHGGYVAAVYYRRVSGSAEDITGLPIYIGGSLEAGNAWQNSSDISVNNLKWSSSLFVGADTYLGPVYLGGAIGSGGQGAAFLYVGQLF